MLIGNCPLVDLVLLFVDILTAVVLFRLLFWQ